MVGIAAAVFVLAPVWLLARAAAAAILLRATRSKGAASARRVVSLRPRISSGAKPDPRYNPKQFRSPK